MLEQLVSLSLHEGTMEQEVEGEVERLETIMKGNSETEVVAKSLKGLRLMEVDNIHRVMVQKIEDDRNKGERKVIGEEITI